jgi:hypothetical protein
MSQPTKLNKGGPTSPCWLLIAAAGLALSVTSRALAQTDNNWTTATSGNWIDPTRWSLGLYPNDGTPPGATYRAVFAAAGPAYTVTLNSDITISGLVLNSAGLTLAHTSGTLTLNGAADITSGTFQLNGGTIAGGTLNLNGGGFNVLNNANNRFRNVTLNGALTMSASGAQLRVTDGLTLTSGSALNLGGSSTQLVFENSQTITGGTINFLNNGFIANVNAGATLTISPTTTVRGGGAIFGDKLSAGPANAIINQGLISADRNGFSLDITADSFTNTGTIEAKNGGLLFIEHLVGDIGAVSIQNSGSFLRLDGDYANSQTVNVPQGATLMLKGVWSNTGTINAAAGSTINLGGTFTMASLGTLNRAGATVQLFGGTLDNTGSALTLGQAGPLTMVAGTILGGTADLTTNNLIFTNSTSHFAGVAITGNINLTTPFARVAFGSGTDLNGTVTLTGESSSLTFDNSQTLSHGTFFFNDPQAAGSSFEQLWLEAGAAVTLGPAVVVHGGGGQIGSVLAPANSLINQGLISSDRPGLIIQLQPNALTNQGTLEAINGGILQVFNATGGTGNARAIGAGSSIVFNTTPPAPYSLDGTLTLSSGGAATLSGNWTNTGVINIGAGSTLNLGGTFPTSAIGTINNSGTVSLTGALQNAGATLPLSGTWRISGGSISGGTIDFGSGGTLFANGGGNSLSAVTLSGSGNLDGNTSGANPVLSFSGGLTMTPGSQLTLIGPGVSLQASSTTTADGGTIVFGGPTGVDRRLGCSSGTLTLGPALIVRGGRGIVGGSSSGGSGTIVNQGRISADVPGQTITLASSVTNNGIVEAINGGTMAIPLYNGGSGIARADGTGSTLSLGSTATGFVLTAPVSATNGANLSISGNTWTNNSTISVDGGTLTLGGSFTRAGMGTINVTSGGTTRLTGTLNATSNTLFLGPATGAWVIDGGFIEGGTLAFPQGYLSLSSNQNNTIHNATTNVPCYLSGGYLFGDSFHPTAGLNISGGAEVWLTNPGFMGAVTVTNSTLNLNGGNSSETSLALTNSNLNILQAGTSMAIVPLVTRTGATTITCTGAMLNTGLTTTFDDTTGVWNMNGVRVDNGTINIVNNNLVFNNSTNNLFNNVTLGTALSMNGGRLNFSGGRVNGAVSLTGGAILSMTSPQAMPPSLAAAGGSSLSISGTYTNAGPIDISGGSSLTLNGSWTNAGTITVTDSTINLGGTFTAASLGNLVRSNATVNLTGTFDNTGSTLTLSPSTGNWNLAGAATTAIISGGTVATTGGAQLTTAPGTLNNRLVGVNLQGNLYMSPLSALRMEGNWSNSGSITVDNATLRLAGTFTGASIGSLIRTPGSRVVLEGTLNNTGSTLTLDGSWETNNGTINGGTLSFAPGSTLLFAPTGNFNSVTVNGDLDIGGLNITGPFTSNGAIRMASGALINASGDSTFTGGTFFANGVSSSMIRCNNVQTTFPSPVLTLSASTVVHGGNLDITSNSQSGSPRSQVINNGLISADLAGRTINLYPEVLTNNATIEAINGGTIQTGPFQFINNGTLRAGAGSTLILSCETPAGSIRLNPGTVLDTAAGTVLVQGIIDNTSNTLSLGANTGTWTLKRGTIRNGTINIGPGGGLAVSSTSDYGLLHDVTLNGSMTQIRSLNIENNFTLSGALTLTTNNDIARFIRSDTLPHTVTGGTFNLVPSNGASVWMQLDAQTNLTLSPTTVVRGGGSSSTSSNAYIGSNQNLANATTLINQGLISSDIAGKRLIIRPNFFNNQGTVEARNAADIEFYNDGGNYNSWSNATGTIRLFSGSHAYLGNTVQSSNIGNYDGAAGQTIVTGTIDNSSQTWNFTPSYGPWTNFGIVKGGTVNVQSGASFTVDGGTLDGIALNGDINVTGGLSIRNGISLNGTIHMVQPGGGIGFTAPFASGLAGGTIAFEGLFGANTRLAAGSINGTTPTEFTIGPAATIRGGIGEIITNSFSTIINQGLISADRPGESITIYLSRFQNEGTLQAINGGNLIFIPPGPPLTGGDGELNNTGLLSIALGTSVTIDGLFTQAASGTLQLWAGADGETSRLWASTIDAGGTLRLGLAPGFVPVQGEVFHLLDAVDLQGHFDHLELPQLPQGWSWNTSTIYGDGSIRAVPEPGVLAMILGGTLLCVRRRRPTREEV